MLEAELDDAIHKLIHQAESFESQLAEFGLARLARREAFQFFRQLVNYDLSVLSAATPSTPETYLDYFVADSPVDCHRDHLMVGAQQVKVLSMKEPPGQTFAHTLVLGATGSGKSFLLNFIVTNAQQYDPFTIVLDLGHGYRKLAALLHGGYLELGLRQRDVSINPFSLEPSPNICTSCTGSFASSSRAKTATG